ncbi:MAG: SCO family protein [Planctomycetes bacterium]|nr:SCO family protein [Planctomycetota bacterium]
MRLIYLSWLAFVAGCACPFSVEHAAESKARSNNADEVSMSETDPSKKQQKLDPLTHGQKIPDASLVNQSGKNIRLSDYRGNVLILTFIYTRCNIQTMCPLVTSKLAGVQNKIAKNNVNSVRFLVVSFDSMYDKPDKLKEFAQRYNINLAVFEFAGGEPETVGNLARSFNIYYRNDCPGVFTHNIIVSIVDKKGVLRDDFFGTEWDDEEMVSVIKQLAVE